MDNNEILKELKVIKKILIALSMKVNHQISHRIDKIAEKVGAKRKK